MEKLALLVVLFVISLGVGLVIFGIALAKFGVVALVYGLAVVGAIALLKLVL